MRKFIEATVFAAMFLLIIGSLVQVTLGATGANPITLQNPLGNNCNDLTCPLTAVTNFLFTIAIPICAILILVGGFQLMTARGKPEDISKAKKTILYAVIGFVIVILSGGVATLIRNVFGA